MATASAAALSFGAPAPSPPQLAEHASAAATPLLNLGLGHPAPSLLPAAAVAAACERLATSLRLGPASASPAAPSLNYGDSPGSPAVLAALAGWLNARLAPGDAPVPPSSLFITNGVSGGLAECAAALARPGDVALLCRPTYFLAAGVFSDAGLRLAEAPCDAAGALDVAALAEALDSGALPAPRVLYVVPSHANPTGATLGAAARGRLAVLALRHRFFVLADETYQHVHWAAAGGERRLRSFDVGDGEGEGEGGGGGGGGGALASASLHPTLAAASAPPASAGPPPPLAPAAGRCVVGLGSASKTLSPALRLGWVEAHPSVLARLAARGATQSGGGAAPLAAALLRELLLPGGGADDALRLVVAGLRARCAALAAALRERAPSCGWDFEEPCGGYFVWLRLPGDLRPASAALVAAARARGVVVLDGARCCALPAPQRVAAAEGGGGALDASAHVRLCFANLSADELREGVARLAAAVEDVRAAARA